MWWFEWRFMWWVWLHLNRKTNELRLSFLLCKHVIVTIVLHCTIQPYLYTVHISMLCSQTLESERDYNSDVNRFTGSSHGLPPPIARSKLVSLSGDLRTGINHYLLECSNSLCVVRLLPPLIRHSLEMAVSWDGLITGTLLVLFFVHFTKILKHCF